MKLIRSINVIMTSRNEFNALITISSITKTFLCRSTFRTPTVSPPIVTTEHIYTIPSRDVTPPYQTPYRTPSTPRPTSYSYSTPPTFTTPRTSPYSYQTTPR